MIQHRRLGSTDSVLTLELEKGSFREDTAISLELKAGHCSLHDDRAIHTVPTRKFGRPDFKAVSIEEYTQQR
ncbi:MAG: hypothetical protein ACHQIL_06665 [Steroidobacterales bacterium]